MTSHLCNNVFASDALLHEDTHFTAFRFLFDFFILFDYTVRKNRSKTTHRKTDCVPALFAGK